MGVISTPNAGGMDPRIPTNKGSVGHTMMLYGNSLSFALGYHEMTTRQSYEWMDIDKCKRKSQVQVQNKKVSFVWFP